MHLFQFFIQLDTSDRLVVLAYLAVMSMLAILGLHRYALLNSARRVVRKPTPELPSELPIVTVQLPIFNELFVVEQLLDSVARLDWPRARLEIQILDDSTDATTECVARVVDELKKQGFRVEHIRRQSRAGFKAGALAAGLTLATGELIAVFDADFRPRSQFLRDIVGHFFGADNADVGMVQVRWGHINRDVSLLTRLQALFLDGHFLIDQQARANSGNFFNFNGTAGVWRRTAIEQAGGWQSDTLTEDLDLSYRAQLAGWRFVYRSDIDAPAELPVDLNAYKSQQHRWAKGSAQTLVKLLPRVLRAPLPARVKLEAFFHLSGNLAYPLLLALGLLVYPAVERRYRGDWSQTLLLDLPFFLLGTISVLTFYAVALHRSRVGRMNLALLPALMVLGIGMAVNNSRAVIAGLFGHHSEFHRTPKAGDTRRHNGYRVGAQLWVLLEAGLGVYFVLLSGRAWSEGLYLSLPFLAMFALGFLTTAGLSLIAHGPAKKEADFPVPRAIDAR